VFLSCADNNKKIDIPGSPAEFDRYKLFEEPSAGQIKSLNFYFLAASYGSAENTYLLSIRAENDKNVYGYYKIIDRDLMPPIHSGIKSDTFPFVFSSIYFKLNGADIDTLKMLMKTYRIGELKDTVDGKQLGGRSREIIVFDGNNLYNRYRSYGNTASIENEYALFFDTVLKRLIPAPPIPSFRR
jgi:hypothetical protein